MRVFVLRIVMRRPLRADIPCDLYDHTLEVRIALVRICAARFDACVHDAKASTAVGSIRIHKRRVFPFLRGHAGWSPTFLVRFEGANAFERSRRSKACEGGSGH